MKSRMSGLFPVFQVTTLLIGILLLFSAGATKARAAVIEDSGGDEAPQRVERIVPGLRIAHLNVELDGVNPLLSSSIRGERGADSQYRCRGPLHAWDGAAESSGHDPGPFAWSYHTRQSGGGFAAGSAPAPSFEPVQRLAVACC